MEMSDEQVHDHEIGEHDERDEEEQRRDPRPAPLEPFPLRLNRSGAPTLCFVAFSRREPVSTSLENALESPFLRAEPSAEEEAAPLAQDGSPSRR
jgi:hypothetical protein